MSVALFRLWYPTTVSYLVPALVPDHCWLPCFDCDTHRRQDLVVPDAGEPPSEVVDQFCCYDSSGEDASLCTTRPDDNRRRRVEVGNAVIESLERMREESKKATLKLVDMECSYLTVDFFWKLPQDIEKGGNPTHSIFNRYNDSYLRRKGNEFMCHLLQIQYVYLLRKYCSIIC